MLRGLSIEEELRQVPANSDPKEDNSLSGDEVQLQGASESVGVSYAAVHFSLPRCRLLMVLLAFFVPVLPD